MGSSRGTQLVIALFIFGSIFCLAASAASDQLPDQYSIVHENELEGIVSEERVIELFRQWKEKHGKVYLNVAEAEKRLENFKRNLKYVLEKHAGMKGAQKGHAVGLNKFADLSNEEFRRTHLSKVKKPASKRWGGQRSSSLDQQRRRQKQRLGSCDSAPSSLDWRNYGVVTAVKDQGSCGHKTHPIQVHETVKRAYHEHIQEKFPQPSLSIMEKNQADLPGREWTRIQVDAGWTEYKAGGAGVAKDCNNTIIKAWFSQFKALSPLQAEAKALLLAVETALELGWTKVWFESDAMNLTEAFSDPFCVPWEVATIVSDIRLLLARFLDWRCIWTPRSNNHHAHNLCKQGLNSPFVGLCILDDVTPLMNMPEL